MNKNSKEEIWKKFCKQLVRWVKSHNWDSLEKDKDLIIRHVRTFTGDEPVLEDHNERYSIIELIDTRIEELNRIIKKYNNEGKQWESDMYIAQKIVLEDLRKEINDRNK